MSENSDQRIPTEQKQEVPRTCPHCGKKKPFEEFGTRTVHGKTHVQTWCAVCRRGDKQPLPA